MHYKTIRDALLHVPAGTHVVVERSIHASLCFADYALSRKLVTNDEFELLKTIADQLLERLVKEFNITYRHVYLKSQPLQCFKHAKVRARSEEIGLTQEEISFLHQFMDVFCSGFITVVNDDMMNTCVETVAAF